MMEKQTKTSKAKTEKRLKEAAESPSPESGLVPTQSIQGESILKHWWCWLSMHTAGPFTRFFVIKLLPCCWCYFNLKVQLLQDQCPLVCPPVILLELFTTVIKTLFSDVCFLLAPFSVQTQFYCTKLLNTVLLVLVLALVLLNLTFKYSFATFMFVFDTGF